MLVYLISTILLIPLMSLINRTRGGGGFKCIQGIPLPSRIKSMIMFGTVIATFAAINNIVSSNAASYLLFGTFDLGLMIASGIGFLVWALLGWGEYMDMGTWQKDHATKTEVGCIDKFIDLLSATFPGIFIRTADWDSKLWNTKHANSDLVGMMLRTGIMSIPLFAFYSWYFSDMYIMLLSLWLFTSGIVYYIWSKLESEIDFTGRAEWTVGAANWGLSIAILFFMIIHNG